MLNKEDTARREALLQKEGCVLPNGDRIVIKDGKITWVRENGMLVVERPAVGAESVLWELIQKHIGPLAKDEPLFVLKGRDPQAGEIVHLWGNARLRAAQRMDSAEKAAKHIEKAQRAYGISTEMMVFKKSHPDLGLPASCVKMDQQEAGHRVAEVLGIAHHYGFVTRVDLTARKPLAMSNYEMKVDVRPVLKRD